MVTSSTSVAELALFTAYGSSHSRRIRFRKVHNSTSDYSLYAACHHTIGYRDMHTMRLEGVARSTFLAYHIHRIHCTVSVILLSVPISPPKP